MFPANKFGDSLAGNLRFAIFAINFFGHFKYLYFSTLSYKKVFKKARVIHWFSMNYPIILARNLTKNPVEACFLHRMLPKMRRVPQKPVFCTARIFRTREGPLRYRIFQTARKRRALLAPNTTNARKVEALSCTALWRCTPYHRRAFPVPNISSVP